MLKSRKDNSGRVDLRDLKLLITPIGSCFTGGPLGKVKKPSKVTDHELNRSPQCLPNEGKTNKTISNT